LGVEITQLLDRYAPRLWISNAMKTLLSSRLVWVLLMYSAGLAITASAQTPVVSVTNFVTTVSEPGGIAEFLIIKDSGPDVTVNFEMGGSAVLGTDYVIVGTTTSVFVPGGTNVATVRIQVLDDFLTEPDKQIVLNLLPGPGYMVGMPSSATMTLRSDDPSLSFQPYIDVRPTLSPALNPPIVAPNSPLNFSVYGLGTYALGFLDSVFVGKSNYIGGYLSPGFRFSITGAPPGLHLLTAVINRPNDPSEILSAPFRVADALLRPSSKGYISNATFVNLNTPYELFTLYDTTPGRGAYMEFKVPPGATNWKSVLFMTPSYNAPHELFTYRGDGLVTTNEATPDAELVATFTPSASPPPLQIDTTKWTQKDAGGFIGFKLQVDPSAPAKEAGAFGAGFNDISLVFFSETNDVPAHFNRVYFPTNVRFADQTFVVELEVYDSDSRIKSARVFDVSSPSYQIKSRTKIGEVLLNLPPGTNFVSIQCTNLSAGTHYLLVELMTESGTTSYFLPSITLFPARAGAPVHRWFGTDGDSKSFYIVDASGRSWVWGDNTNGQLGIGFRGEPITRPVMLTPPAGKKWRRFTSASYCAVGVTDDGAIYGMGKNIDNSSIFYTADPNVPLPLPMRGNFLARRAGLTQHSLWIINELFELVPLFGPVASVGSSFVDFDTGGEHLLGIDGSGQLYYWPGDGSSSTYGAVAGATLPWKEVSTCSTHSLALDAKGQLFAWGFAEQLPFRSGVTVTSPQYAPFPAGVTTWKNVAAGKYVSLAVDQNGKLFSWGKQDYTGSAEPYVRSKIVPVQVPPEETDWLDIAVGSSFAMALSTRGNVYVWGDIPASPAARHVDFPELVTGFPDLLNAADAAAPVVTFEPTSVRAASEFAVDLIAPAGSNLAIETSSDLLNWTTVTNIVNAAPKTTFRTSIPGSGNLFIRVR
jgi:hypothetical protein